MSTTHSLRVINRAEEVQKQNNIIVTILFRNMGAKNVLVALYPLAFVMA